MDDERRAELRRRMDEQFRDKLPLQQCNFEEAHNPHTWNNEKRATYAGMPPGWNGDFRCRGVAGFSEQIQRGRCHYCGRGVWRMYVEAYGPRVNQLRYWSPAKGHAAPGTGIWHWVEDDGFIFCNAYGRTYHETYADVDAKLIETARKLAKQLAEQSIGWMSIDEVKLVKFAVMMKLTSDISDEDAEAYRVLLGKIDKAIKDAEGQ